MKKSIITVLLSLSIFMGMTMAAEATTGTKTINVDYRNIILYVNGNAVSVQANEEPFIYEGRTFVPIRIVSEALGQNVEWIDFINAVKISGGNGATPDLLAQKEQEIEDLKLQLAQKDNEITSLKDRLENLEDDEDEDEDEDTDSEISDLQEDLISDFDDLEDVSIDDISLDGDEDDVNVTIEVDLDEYDDEWEELADSDIENWIEDLVESIQDTLSDDTSVTGEIIDTDSDDVLVKFEQDGDDDLEVDYKDDDYREGSSDSDADDVIDSLEDDRYTVDDIDFTVGISFDGDDRVTATFQAADNDASSAWEDLSDSTIEGDVTDICQEIAAAFEDDADITLDTIRAYFYDEDELLLKNFNYDVNDEELD